VLPLWLQLLLLCLSGVFGYEPPVWLNLDKGLKWMGCRTPDPTDPPPPTGKDLVWFWCGLFFHVLMFLVDFADAILDFWLSIRETLGLASDREDDPRLVGWAVWYFLGTVVGRTLGGLLALFYHRIDESDRETTYLLVEMTIIAVEDVAALGFIGVKRRNGVELTHLDHTNRYLSYLCVLVFVVPILCRYKRITENLPWFVSCVCLIYMTVVPLYVIGHILGLGIWLDHNLSDSQSDTFARVNYGCILLPMLYVLYHWVRYLLKKEKAREQQQLVPLPLPLPQP